MADISAVSRVHMFDSANAFFCNDFAGYKTTIWAQTLKEHETFEHCLDYSSYKGIASLGSNRVPRQGDRINVYSPDNSQSMSFQVIGVDRGGLHLQRIEQCVRNEPKLSDDSGLAFKWNVGKRAWDVVRVDTKAVLSSGFPNKEAAMEWISNYSMKKAA